SAAACRCLCSYSYMHALSTRSNSTSLWSFCLSSFFFNDPSPTEIYTLSLHDALPILTLPAVLLLLGLILAAASAAIGVAAAAVRSEEHTSELQSRGHLVCRLLLEKKKKERN